MYALIPEATFRSLVEAEVFTVDPDKKETCCGLPRDEIGQCTHRPGHPIYVDDLKFLRFDSQPMVQSVARQSDGTWS